MAEDDWQVIAARLSPVAPADLDGDGTLLPAAGPRRRAGGWLGRDILPERPPAAAAWAARRTGGAAIGVRVGVRPADPAGLAARLLAMAAERDAEPVILSRPAVCGLEQFGFRVERLAGRSERELAACEAELAAFWDMAIVIDAEALGSFG